MKEEYRDVLWDIDEKQVETLPADFIMRRVLSYGTLGLIAQSIKMNGVEAVRGVFLKMNPASISAKKYHYLKNYLLA